jgi:hypothetical protein
MRLNKYIELYEKEMEFDHWITGHMLCSSHGSLWFELMSQFDSEGNGLNEFMKLAKQLGFRHDLDNFYTKIERKMVEQPFKLFREMMS